jgi:hypothetical protein
MGTLSMNHFQSYLFYILYDIRLSSTFSWAFFLSMWSSVFVLCCCFFSRCQYYMNYWTHPQFNCWQNIPDYWVYRNGKTKNTLSITLDYIFLWNVIRRIYLPCLQLISKNTFDEPWREPPPFLNLKSGRMTNDNICSGKLFARSVCCFGFRLGIDFNS